MFTSSLRTISHNLTFPQALINCCLIGPGRLELENFYECLIFFMMQFLVLKPFGAKQNLIAKVSVPLFICVQKNIAVMCFTTFNYKKKDYVSLINII